MDKVPEAANDESAPLKMQIANLGFDNFLGRLGIGRIYSGTVKVGQEVFITSPYAIQRCPKNRLSLLYHPRINGF